MDEAQRLRILYALETAQQAKQQGPAQVQGPQSGGFLSDLGAGLGKFVAERNLQYPSPLDPNYDPMQQIQAGPVPDTAGAKIGEALPQVIASMALPGAGFGGMAAQGGLAAGFEALKTDASLGSVTGAGLTAAAFTGAFDLAGRTLSGMATRVQNAIKGEGAKILQTQSQRLRTLAETLGGLGSLNRGQQQVVTRAAVESIGESGASLSAGVRQQAATRIGAAMDAAKPTGPVDVTAVFTHLDDIPAFPGKSEIMQLVQRAETSPAAFQDAGRQLRDAIRNVRRGPNADWADEIFKGLDMLQQAGEAAGAASTRVVREQYKNLMLLEAIPAVRNTGQVPALSAANRIFSQYGNTTTRNAGAGTLPQTQRFIQTVQQAAEEIAQRFKSSGTAERGVQAVAAEETLGLLTGSTSGSAAMRAIGSATLTGPLLGAAAMGKAIPGAGQAGAAVAEQVRK